MAAPAGSSYTLSLPLAAALAALPSPAAGGNGTHPKAKTSGGGGICVDLVSPHTARGVLFNNLVGGRGTLRYLF